MTHVFCVRAGFGSYTKHFVADGYVAIGWILRGLDIAAAEPAAERTTAFDVGA